MYHVTAIFAAARSSFAALLRERPFLPLCVHFLLQCFENGYFCRCTNS
jgi:hypothetical protein